jgi:hypothetical protein
MNDKTRALDGLTTQAKALVERTWSRIALKRVVPDHEEPIATRCDPSRMQVHVACASGKSYVVSIEALQAADEKGPLIIPEDVGGGVLVDVEGKPLPPSVMDKLGFGFDYDVPSPGNLLQRMREAQDRFEAQLRKEKTRQEAIEESLDVPLAKDLPLENETEKWTIAVARLMELKEALKNNEAWTPAWDYRRNSVDGEITVFCDQHDSQQPADILAIKDGFHTETYALCAQCFVADMNSGTPEFRLDCDAEDTTVNVPDDE